jgi:ketosteroid isomerase-like protein
VEWTITGPINLLSYCGERRGKAEVLELVDRAVPAVIDVTLFVQDVLVVDGEWAAALSRVAGIRRGTGRTISYRLAQFVHFRDGKVDRYRSIIDSFDAAEQVLGRRIDPTRISKTSVSEPARRCSRSDAFHIAWPGRQA